MRTLNDDPSSFEDRASGQHPWFDGSNFDASDAGRYDHPADASTQSPRDRDATQAGDRDLRIDLSPADRILRKTRQVALGNYHCPVDHPQFAVGGGPHTCFYIAFHHTSVKLKIGNWQPEVLTPNNVSFYNCGESYSREAIGREGDDCDWIALAPAMLGEIRAADELEHQGVGGRAFPRASAPIKPEVFFAQRKMFAALSNTSNALNSMQLEEAVLGLTSRIVDDALGFWGCRSGVRRRPRPTCQRRRLQIIEEAKSILAREYWTDLSLTDLANQLHRSAAHLSRLFHAATGFRLGDYRQELRLRKGLFLLEESGLDIGDIAIRVGFASHSHFTSAFHRRFGTSPSQFLNWRYSDRRDVLVRQREYKGLLGSYAPVSQPAMAHGF